MPELPEVEHARRQLSRHWEGRRVRELQLTEPTTVRSALSTSPRHAWDGAQAWAGQWSGQCVGPVLRRGKRLGWSVGRLNVLCHLGMTGRWIRRDLQAVPHGRLRVSFDDGQIWWFEDQRRFGAVCPTERSLEDALGQGMGPEPWPDPLTGLQLQSRLAGRGSIKTQLMDQSRLAGVGNIQATEALWKAGVHPLIGGNKLNEQDFSRIAAALVWTLSRTLREAGADEMVYVSQDPSSNPFRVYGRVGQPCDACNEPIQAIRIAGRISPFCPTCQTSAG
ncbi:MAG: Fpg/Nei family DNA glycosylase [Myxococcota bacterium]